MNIQKDFILLIPYFNDYKGLIESINSIVYPSDKFEILVVDDGSKIPLSIEKNQLHNPGANIEIIRLQENSGVAKALNAGLNRLHSRDDYKYIARLDCGDICHPERFTKQVKYMNEHPEIALLGTWCEFSSRPPLGGNGGSGKSYLYKTKTEHKDILKEMHFKCSFIHPTVMFRKEIIERVGFYPENYPHAEDYAYFWKIMLNFEGFILPQVLVTVKINENNLSYRNRKEQFLMRKKIVSEMGNNITYKILGLCNLKILGLLPAKFANKLKYILK